MSDNSHAISPQYAAAEAVPAPPGSAFEKHSAASVRMGDLVMLGTAIYRVRLRYADPHSPRIVFVLYPVLGGLIIREARFPREWLPSVLADDLPASPLPPVEA